MPVGEMPPSLKKFLSSAATTALIMSRGISSYCSIFRLVVPNRPMRLPSLE